VAANPQLFRNPYKVTSEILNAAKAALKGVEPRQAKVPSREASSRAAASAHVAKDDIEHSFVLADPPSPAMEVSVDTENVSMQGNTASGESLFSQPKKAKLSAELIMKDDKFLSSSPDLHHNVPLRQPKDSDDSEDDEVTEDNRLHTHLF
jgi:hypothetical protein